MHLIILTMLHLVNQDLYITLKTEMFLKLHIKMPVIRLVIQDS